MRANNHIDYDGMRQLILQYAPLIARPRNHTHVLFSFWKFLIVATDLGQKLSNLGATTIQCQRGKRSEKVGGAGEHHQFGRDWTQICVEPNPNL